MNAVDAKRSSLHKHRISQDHQRAIIAEASLSRAKAAVVEAKANYDEVSARVLREVDRFRREYAVEMHATMVEFARMQKGRYDGMQEVWETLLLRVKGMNASATTGCSFAREAAALREGGSTTMPTYIHRHQNLYGMALALAMQRSR
jgi:hypothetical protein